MLFSETNTRLKHRCWYLAQVLLQHVNRTCFLFCSMVVKVEGTSCMPITFCHGVCIISESCRSPIYRWIDLMLTILTRISAWCHLKRLLSKHGAITSYECNAGARMLPKRSCRRLSLVWRADKVRRNKNSQVEMKVEYLTLCSRGWDNAAFIWFSELLYMSNGCSCYDQPRSVWLRVEINCRYTSTLEENCVYATSANGGG